MIEFDNVNPNIRRIIAFKGKHSGTIPVGFQDDVDPDVDPYDSTDEDSIPVHGFDSFDNNETQNPNTN